MPTYSDAGRELARADVVTGFGEDRQAEEKRIIELLRDAGLTLLSAEEVEATVDFHPPDGRFPVSTFVMSSASRKCLGGTEGRQ